MTLKATAADAVGGAVKVISGNRVLAGGAAAGQFVVVRLRKTGTLDSKFGTGGQVVPALPGTTLDGVRALAIFRDGRIVAAGTLRLADGTTRLVAFRLLPTGEIDPSFGAGFGYVLAGPPGSRARRDDDGPQRQRDPRRRRARARSRSSSGCWPTAARTRRSAPAARSTAPRSGSPAASPGCSCAPTAR